MNPLDQSDSSESANSGQECDCIVEGVTITCLIFFVVFAILLITTTIVLLNYRNVRRRSKQPALMKNTKKF